MALAISALFVIRLALTQSAGAEAFRRRILVLGAGARAARLAALADEPGSGLEIVGFVAMSGAEKKVVGAVPREEIANLSDHVVALRAGEVVLALEERRNALPLNDLLRVKTTGVHVNDIASFIERETGRVDLATTNPSGLIFSDGFSAGQRISKVGKRLFDILASLIVLVIGLPLIVVAGIAVMLDSRGPVFYRQPRVGLFGEPYDIYKIRSMRTDAEAAGKAVWASENDPRVTRVGRIIRKLRIDELPQLWCVLKGEMSFVGPRPERPSFVDELEQKMPYYAERHMVKPGLTGWAQINYPYGASVEDARVKLEYDLYYAKNYSPFLDLLILLQTVRVVLWPDGRALTMLTGLSEILSVLALVGFSAVALWLLARPKARMAVLMPAPRLLTLPQRRRRCGVRHWRCSGPDRRRRWSRRRCATWRCSAGWLRPSGPHAAPMSRPLRLILRLLVTICVVTLVFGRRCALARRERKRGRGSGADADVRRDDRRDRRAADRR